MPEPKLAPAIPQLPTGDIEETAAFFSEKLNFEIVAKAKQFRYLTLKRGSAEIHFWEAETKEQARALGSSSSCYIRVEGVQELFNEFKANGVSFRYELTKQPWGMFEMQIDDPYLNAIRFGEPYKNIDGSTIQETE